MVAHRYPKIVLLSNHAPEHLSCRMLQPEGLCQLLLLCYSVAVDKDLRIKVSCTIKLFSCMIVHNFWILVGA